MEVGPGPVGIAFADGQVFIMIPGLIAQAVDILGNRFILRNPDSGSENSVDKGIITVEI